MTQDLSVVVWSKKGCSYCDEVKQYLTEQDIAYQTIDVTDHDEFRDILDIKYGVRHVPVVEIGAGDVYSGVTKVGLEHVQNALGKVRV